MRVKSGFEMREVCGEHVIFAEGIENIDFSKIISLNETAAYVWKEAVKADFTPDQLVQALCEAYEVEPDVAAADVKELLDKWEELGMVEA